MRISAKASLRNAVDCGAIPRNPGYACITNCEDILYGRKPDVSRFASTQSAPVQIEAGDASAGRQTAGRW